MSTKSNESNERVMPDFNQEAREGKSRRTPLGKRIRQAAGTDGASIKEARAARADRKVSDLATRPAKMGHLYADSYLRHGRVSARALRAGVDVLGLMVFTTFAVAVCGLGIGVAVPGLFSWIAQLTGVTRESSLDTLVAMWFVPGLLASGLVFLLLVKVLRWAWRVTRDVCTRVLGAEARTDRTEIVLD